MPVHLPNEYNVILEDISNEIKLVEAMNQVTMLMEYFKLNARDKNARQFVYSEIQKHYVYKKDTDNKKITIGKCDRPVLIQ